MGKRVGSTKSAEKKRYRQRKREIQIYIYTYIHIYKDGERERGGERERVSRGEEGERSSVPESAFAAQKHNLRTVAPRYQATARATELCRSVIPVEAVECFRAECLRRRAGKHTRCRGSFLQSSVPRTPTPFSFDRRGSAGTPTLDILVLASLERISCDPRMSEKATFERSTNRRTCIKYIELP